MKLSVHPGWWQVAVSMVVQGISAASIYTAYSIVATPLKSEFAPTQLVLMLGMTVTSLVSGALSPPLGTAIDRFSLRRLMFGGACLLAVGFLLLSIATSMVQVIAIYAVCMASASVLLGPIATSALLARWFTRRRGLAMGLASSGAAIGGLLLPPLLQGLIDGLEWRLALRIFGAVIFVVTAPLIALLVINRPGDRGLQAESDSPATEPDGAESGPLSTTTILRDLRFWLISLVLGTVFFGSVGLISNLIQFVSLKGIDAAGGALLLSIFSGATFAGKLLCAGVIDRANLRLAIAAMLGLIGLSVCSLLLAHSYPLLAIASSVYGIAAGAAVPIWGVVLARVYGPERIGQVMGIMTFVIMPFTLFSPPIFGWVYDRSGTFNGALGGYLVMLTLALALLTQLRLAPAPPADT